MGSVSLLNKKHLKKHYAEYRNKREFWRTVDNFPVISTSTTFRKKHSDIMFFMTITSSEAVGFFVVVNSGCKI